MGAVFKYVADREFAAGRLADTPCSICESEVDVFYVIATAEIPGYGAGTITEACAPCIRSFRPDQVDALDTEKRLPVYFEAEAPALNKAELDARLRRITEELRRTPRLPHFPQRDDWPFCCGDIAEYHGEPSVAEADVLDRNGQYWDRGPKLFHDKAAALVPSSRLAVIGGVSEFRCSNCGKLYWTFQCT